MVKPNFHISAQWCVSAVCEPGSKRLLGREKTQKRRDRGGKEKERKKREGILLYASGGVLGKRDPT